MAERGRPSSYTEAKGEEICLRLENGESLNAICRDDDQPKKTTIYRWLEDYPDFRDRYVRAREVQADTLVDQCMDIADDGSNDWMERETKKGTIKAVDHEHVQRSKLRIDTRMWLAKMMASRKYGDKSKLEVEVNDITLLPPEKPSED